ncbi:MAG: helix-turn-helix domain-containing protein [Acidimicrobiia bacterium]
MSVAAAGDAERIVEATYRVIERTGTIDPRVRDILDEAGLSSPAFYRHFASKDELMLVIFDDGLRRQAEYLAHRMEAAPNARARVRAWIEGVVAQAVDPEAASRTRPFVANIGRLADQFPAEKARAEAVLLQQLEDALAAAAAAGELELRDPHRDARAVYDITYAYMEQRILTRTTPSRADIDHLVAFCERALSV